jgi:hypothetical protein
MPAFAGMTALMDSSSVVIPAKAGIVRLKAHLVREVEVLFRYALSGL